MVYGNAVLGHEAVAACVRKLWKFDVFYPVSNTDDRQVRLREVAVVVCGFLGTGRGGGSLSFLEVTGLADDASSAADEVLLTGDFEG